ncbi:hydantoinase B/oxoprolinase family protein [Isoptericola sp. b441]|uniref:Hydantoinase B/oxoprolinase family protein n=1 Tax=Actinotalea lenta TaxID=3064654 RepID=A0ABT9DF61_9CELL|nr:MULTISPECIES: hydantoinase B/oxoprolinase family protein [unclassified Isoptericola]MDO8108147.1 hydantoinase B/oxoprolinase family protein [Isoptericola sp. b441]MDO8120182.1 hydantoinase B/oxoprolinase family protein [Isoptericola sp. b490]
MSLDPITLSVLRSALAGIAEEMGTVLVRSAYSSNIKERRDCSAALFDADARMVAQAEHIPVHLGAMPESVAAVRARGARPGETWILNDPYTGGTHLPDVTLVTPVGVDGAVVGYAVTRAHHSDVGGMAPGSMPAGSRDLWQEGLVIPPLRMTDEVLELVCANSRTPRLRRGDFRAQAAANRVGGLRVVELAERVGLATLLAGFDEVIAYAERRTREALRALPDGTYRARTELEGDGVTDEDIPIQVAVTIHGDSATIDLTGTSDAVAGNVNCPVAVTRSACFFALRVLLPEDVPACAGTYAPLDIRAPEGSLVNARPPHAVVAGNVETSQRVADAVLAAFAQVADVPASGTGTMNNTVIGGEGWTYYETVAGGQGASRVGPGPSGVHVGMTNTLNTPIEALELEYPMRVERYELADGSGGPGAHRGGDGVVRAIRVLQDASVNLLTDRRRHAPPGLAGGAPGAVGRNLLETADATHELEPKVARRVSAGDVVTLVTPGGGGWGEPGREPGRPAGAG